MFDFGWWGEAFIIIIVAILVVDPKDLPTLLKKVSSFLRTFRSTRADLEKTFHEWLESTRNLSEVEDPDEHQSHTKE